MFWPARTTRMLLLLAVALTLSACAKRIPDATPDDIPSLRAELAINPTNATTGTRLGIALVKAEQYPEAREVLRGAETNGSETGANYLYLGLANEGIGEWALARNAYQRYLDRGTYGPLLDDIRDRLQFLIRQELQVESRAALAAEDSLSAATPTPRSIAVFPFRLIGNEAMDPLRIALADMMITDLSVSNALTVLERTQIQSLLNEMSMTDAGLTEETTGARVGRLLRAEHVVQGALTTVGQNDIRFDAEVLNTARGASAGQVADEDALESIFDLEKAAVFQVLDVLGVTLTPAEREAIDENRAENLLAFLAYGEGLQAMDRGDFQAASGFFSQSLQLDPSFAPAQSQSAEAEALDDASTATTGAIAAVAVNEMSSSGIGAPPQGGIGVGGLTGTLAGIGNGVNPTPTGGQIDLGNTGGTGGTSGDGGTKRDPVQESGGNEGKTQPTTARIRITIRRPGGLL